eukprot:3297053-Karenia_brevis.AAC.1
MHKADHLLASTAGGAAAGESAAMGAGALPLFAGFGGSARCRSSGRIVLARYGQRPEEFGGGEAIVGALSRNGRCQGE